jgi:predicted lysophospholipase L1 biosynthesis ABC-type transport system permease subunit
LIGWLIFRSTFLPRILGALLTVAGLGYLIGMLARFILPTFATHLFPYILWPGLLAEASLTLWLIAVGVNVQRWREQVDISD